jgi:hypothetical protein
MFFQFLKFGTGEFGWEILNALCKHGMGDCMKLDDSWRKATFILNFPTFFQLCHKDNVVTESRVVTLKVKTNFITLSAKMFLVNWYYIMHMMALFKV